MTATIPRKSPIGRAIVVAVFAIATAWGGTAVVGSVVVDLYGAAPKHDEPSATFRERSWCARRLTALQSELDARVTHETRTEIDEGDPTGKWRAFAKAWQEDHAQAAQECTSQSPDMARAFNQLGTLFQGLDTGTTHILQTRSSVGAPLRRTARDLLPHP